MKKIICFIAGLLIGGPVLAQEVEEIAEYMNRYRQAMISRNNDSIASACCDISNYYSYRDLDSTLKYTRKGLEHADSEQDSPYLELMNNLGFYYNSIGDSRKSIDILLQTAKEAERLDADMVLRGDILSSIGVGYRRRNQLDSALFYYDEALSCYQAKEGGATDSEAFLLTNIAVLYANTSHIEEAETYIRKAIEKTENTEDMDTRLFVSNTAGAIFNLRHNYKEAEEIMLKSLDYARKEDKAHFVLQSVSPLLSLYDHTGNRAALDRLISDTRPWLDRLPANNVAVLGYQETIAAIYFAEKRFDESAALYRKLLEANDENALTPKELLYLWLARNYVEMGESGKAADYYEKAYATRDSVLISDINSSLAEFSAKFDTQQKELEIARLNEERLQHHNLIMIWSIVSIISIIGLGLFFFIDRNRRKQQKQKQELDVARSFIDGLENERARLAKELHDGICNELLGVGMMLNLKETREDNSLEIRRQIEEIRSEVRSISHELTPPKFQYTTLNEIVEDMLGHLFRPKGIELHLVQEGERILWEKIPTRHAYETYRIIQELSSNIALYAEASRIDVSMKVSERGLDIVIVDNGKEFDPTRCTRRGIGLSTINERVKAIEAEFAISYEQGKQHFRLQTSWRRK